MKVRRWRLEDTSAISQIEQEAFSDPWRLDSIAVTCQLEQTIALTAQAGEEIVGYVLARGVVDEAEIMRIAVSKKSRRKGVGSALLAGLREACRDAGIRKILLDVRAGNQAAASFYLGFGFREDGCRRNYYRNPQEDAILMSWEIG